MTSFFIELSLVLILAFIIAYIMNRVGQPPLIGYILTGVLVGPIFFNLLGSVEGYRGFAHIGVAFLLFIVGLHLNVRLIREVGPISLLTGLGEVVLVSALGFVLCLLLGLGVPQAIIVSIAISFSSTIVVVQLLTDRNALDTLHGKIAVGFLIIQDLVAVVVLMILGSMINLGSSDLYTTLMRVFFFGFLTVLGLVVVAHQFLPKLLRHVAKSPQLLFIFSIAWCFGLAALFEVAGFSLEIGALAAGVALATSPFQRDISSRIKPLRDFFIVLFFIFLGYEMLPPLQGLGGMLFRERLASVWAAIQPIFSDAVMISIFVFVITPIIIMAIMLPKRYSSKTGFLVGVSVSQISEFSIIMVLLARDAKIVGADEISLITMVAVITIAGSTYLFTHANATYAKLQKYLRRFEQPQLRDARQGIQGTKHQILLFGMNRIGMSLLKALRGRRKKYLVIDHNPERVKRISEEGVPVVYGDASNAEFLAEFDLKDVKLLISTIKEYEVNEILLVTTRRINKQATIVLTAEDVDDALDLYDKGADYVILPHFLGGHYVSTLIEDFHGNPSAFLKERIRHLSELQERKRAGHKHPSR